MKYAYIVAALIVGTTFTAWAEEPSRILLQIKAGFNPDHVVYEKLADVTINDKHIGGRFVITETTDPNDPPAKQVLLHKLQPGDAVMVDATFANLDKSDTINCTRTFPVIAPDSIGCGPIEIGYQAFDNTCIIVCN